MILITGASGFVGRALTRQLTQMQQEWLAYNGRLNDPHQLRQALKGIHTVIHLASSEGRGRDRQLQRVDRIGTQRMLDECRRAQVGHFIYVSRIGADPNSLHTLLRVKGENEQAIRRSRLPYTIIRSASLFGHGDRFTEILTSLALWSWPLVWLPGGGEMAMQPLWVEDLARCVAQTPVRPDLMGQTISLAGEERIAYRDMVYMLLHAAGVARLPLKMPLVLLRPFTSLLFGWWYWPPVTRYFVDRFFVPEITELDTVLRQFGFRPARMINTLNHITRPGLRWRIFRR